MNTSLPVVQSIPHAGLAVPPTLSERLAIDDVTVYNECDLWNEQIFDFAHPSLAQAGQSLAVVEMPIARVLIDANRPPDSLEDPDGAVKSQTSYGDPIYRLPLARDEQTALLDEHWRPFHDALDSALRRHAGQTKLFLDCHNMAQHGPSAYGDPGQVRPLVCIANFGDARGDYRPSNGPLTAPAAFVRQAGKLAAEIFGDLTLLEPDPGYPAPVVGLNLPFRGGYILRHYCDQSYQSAIGSNYAGLMVEVNRGLFVGDQSTRTPIQPPNQERIAAVRERLLRWLYAILPLVEQGR